MGGLTSKHVEEVVNTPETEGTPKKTHILFDPRSPSDYIARTPIAVSNTPIKSGDQTPCGNKLVVSLPDDPHSPAIELSHTPVQIETKETQRRQISLRPSRLAQLESVSSTSSEDPRSPTSRIPRTPLENKEHIFSGSEGVEQEDTESREEKPRESTENTKDDTADHNSSPEKKLTTDGPTDKVRHPLTSVQNTGSSSSTPRGILQAKQCRNVEDEYNKSQQTIMSQLTGEEKVASSTQFVESI